MREVDVTGDQDLGQVQVMISLQIDGKDYSLLLQNDDGILEAADVVSGMGEMHDELFEALGGDTSDENYTYGKGIYDLDINAIIKPAQIKFNKDILA